MSESNEMEIIDPDLKEQLEDLPTEDPLLTEYGSQGKGEKGEAIDFVSEWFPNAENWQGKTNIHGQQAKALALLRHLPELYPEIENLDSFLNGFITDYEQYLTSIEGEARMQHTDILKALFGKGGDTDETESLLRQKIFSDMQNENSD